MFLGLGTSALAICKVPYHISIIMTPVCIVLGGIANIWSYHILGDLYERYKINNYEHLCQEICGRKMTLFLVITLNIYTVGLLLIHQVLIFRLLGGIINVIGGYNYESMLTFLSDTYWNQIWVKLCVNFGIGILIIFPLCLVTDMKKLNISSTIGVFTTLFIFLVVLIQFPFYFMEYLEKEYNSEDENTHVNIYKVERGFTKQIQFLQAFALFFFCFTGHNGLLPALEHLEDPTPARRAKLYNIAIAMDMIIYLVIAICGYLSVPVDVVDIVFERKRIGTHDVVMTIARILLIPMAISKIQVNHNIWRISFVSFIGNDHTKITLKFNLIFTGITLFITTLVSTGRRRAPTKWADSPATSTAGTPPSANALRSATRPRRAPVTTPTPAASWVIFMRRRSSPTATASAQSRASRRSAASRGATTTQAPRSRAATRRARSNAPEPTPARSSDIRSDTARSRTARRCAPATSTPSAPEPPEPRRRRRTSPNTTRRG